MAQPPPAQLVFRLDGPPRFGRDDFLPASCNLAALQTLERWPDWPDCVLILRGPAGAGKSHLGAIWASLSHAPTCLASEVDAGTVDRLRAAGALFVEDADRLPRDEPSLFHLLNAARQSRCYVLLTARSDPMQWGIRVPDLLSRLRLAPTATIDDPDDALVRAVLVKLLADRQLGVDVNLIDYAAKNLGRSLADARSFVELADGQSLAAGRRITRTIAADVLAAISSSRDEGD
jgi:chromosomal replication initiation ATPase DnaA